MSREKLGMFPTDMGDFYFLGENQISEKVYGVIASERKENAELKLRIKQLEKKNESLCSLIEDILVSIPETYLTGYGWDDEFEEIKEQGK